MGSQLLIDTILGEAPAETWPTLVDHIAFHGDTPDPILGALLERSNSDKLALARPSSSRTRAASRGDRSQTT